MKLTVRVIQNHRVKDEEGGSKDYLAGQTVEIEEEQYSPNLYQKLEEKPRRKKEKDSEE